MFLVPPTTSCVFPPKLLLEWGFTRTHMASGISGGKGESADLTWVEYFALFIDPVYSSAKLLLKFSALSN